MAYVPMPWELEADQLRWSTNIAPAGAPPYYLATSQQQELQDAQAAKFGEEFARKLLVEEAKKKPVGNKQPTPRIIVTDVGDPPRPPEPSMAGVNTFGYDTAVRRLAGSGTIYTPAPGTRVSVVPGKQPVTTTVTGSKTGEVVDAIADTGAGYCATLTNTAARLACEALVGIGRRVGGGSGGSTAGSGGSTGGGSDPRSEGLTNTTGCTAPYVWNETTKQCERPGLVGTGQRTVPGGQSGTMADIYGDAVVGVMGVPALVPAVVGSITRNDGSSGPVLRCPAGAVLGRDDLCYMKGSIPRNWRKHPPGTKPFLTGGQVRILRRAKGLESRFKRLTSGKAALFKPAKKCGSCSRKKK